MIQNDKNKHKYQKYDDNYCNRFDCVPQANEQTKPQRRAISENVIKINIVAYLNRTNDNKILKSKYAFLFISLTLSLFVSHTSTYI